MNTNPEPIVCESDMEELLRLGYEPGELADIELLLKPLCRTARLYLARIFVRARICKKMHFDVMEACCWVWEDVWKHGTADRLGDPDDTAPPDVGMRNTLAFFEVYRRLGLATPKFLF